MAKTAKPLKFDGKAPSAPGKGKVSKAPVVKAQMPPAHGMTTRTAGALPPPVASTKAKRRTPAEMEAAKDKEEQSAAENDEEHRKNVALLAALEDNDENEATLYRYNADHPAPAIKKIVKAPILGSDKTTCQFICHRILRKKRFTYLLSSFYAATL